jgi:hypothetical protein
MPTLTEGNMGTMDMLLDRFSALKERTIRHWLQSKPDRFRERCVMTVGRKLYFDLAAMEQWLLEHRGASVRKG